jgi:GH24 family phage-related lysozyme (muramidase)
MNMLNKLNFAGLLFWLTVGYLFIFYHKPQVKMPILMPVKAVPAKKASKTQWPIIVPPVGGAKVVEAAMEFVKQEEGCRKTAYKDAGGIKTVGYGHVVMKKDKLFGKLTEAQMEALLRNDVLHAQQTVLRNVHINLNVNQLAALTSFTYNVGAGAFAKSSLLKAVNSGNVQNIRDSFLTFCTVKGREVRGLKVRRLAERELYFR